MQKRIRIVSAGIVLIIILIGLIVINNKSNNKYSFTQDGIKYALTLDGEKITSFPSKGMYKAQVTCIGADGKWLYDDWKLAIENITSDNVTCDIKFETIPKTNLNDYTISLAGTTQGLGQVVNENGYRYEGKNPNNYIWFNNEYWRIIGVFDSATHGQAGKNLVKIIRDKQIGYQTWDSAGTNNWSTSSLKSLLNDYYYKATDGTNSGKCYGYSNTVTSNCNYTKNGIQSYYRNLIQSVTWHLGGYNSIAVTANNFYTYERGTTVNGSNPTTTTGYIGLMYPSDFGYTALESDCARTTLLSEYITVACAGASWLSGRSFDLTLTQYTTNATQTISISREGKIAARDAIGNFGVSPVLYLNSSVYLVDGNGSLDNPYIIAS